MSLPDGRSVDFRGYADRIDVGADGTIHVVDYKTGRPDDYLKLSEDNPDDLGRRLQLAVYGQAARMLMGAPDADVLAQYWFVSAKGRFKRVGYSVTPEVLARVGKTVGMIVEGIEAGVFPHHPTASSTDPWVRCVFCDPDGLGVTDLRRQLDRKQSDLGLAPSGIWWTRRRSSTSIPRRKSCPMPDPVPSSRPGGPSSDHRGPRHDAVRRGRRRIGEDLGPGRPGAGPGDERRSRAAQHRRHHLHRESRCRASRPHPGRLESAAEADPGGEDGARCRHALDQLDGAAIGTLHSFAQRLLSEHPIEAGLPPRVEVLDEVSSKVAFEAPLVDRSAIELLADLDPGTNDPAAARLRRQARRRSGRWPRPSTTTGTWSRKGFLRTDPSHLRRCIAVVRWPWRPSGEVCAEPCRDPDDKLRVRLDEIADRMRRVGGRSTDELELLEAIGNQPPSRCRASGSANRAKKASCDCDLKEFRRGYGGRRRPGGRPYPGGQRLRRADRQRHPCLHPASGGRPQARRSAGVPRPSRAGPGAAARPDHGPAVRATLHERYQRLLLDEFQDTDPIQIELAVRIAAADPRASRQERELWDEVDVAPGQLFVVGDPKQSIYRFRRADISTFLASRPNVSAPRAAGTVELTANFRTVASDHRVGQHDVRRSDGEPDDVDDAGAVASPTTSL